MHRLSAEAIPRKDLAHALRDRRLIREFIRIDKCILCRRIGVNEAALCDVCYSLLNEVEAPLAEAWLRGGGP